MTQKELDEINKGNVFKLVAPVEAPAPSSGERLDGAPGSAATVYGSIGEANDALPKCPKPLADSDGNHWWYYDAEADEERAEAEENYDSIPCVCKTCEETMLLSAEADEIPV